MQVRISSIIAALGATLFAAALPLSATVQEGSPPSATAPLDLRVQMPATGEAATLDGIIAVRGTVSSDPDGGPPILSYSCDSSGRARGESSGATFTISGSDSGKTPISQSVPTDVGLICSMTVVAESVRQVFELTFQAGLDDAGSITSLVIRTIAAR